MISLGMSCKSTLSENTILIELLAIGPPQDLQQTIKFYLCYYKQYFYVKRYFKYHNYLQCLGKKTNI